MSSIASSLTLVGDLPPPTEAETNHLSGSATAVATGSTAAPGPAAATVEKKEKKQVALAVPGAFPPDDAELTSSKSDAGWTSGSSGPGRRTSPPASFEPPALQRQNAFYQRGAPGDDETRESVQRWLGGLSAMEDGDVAGDPEPRRAEWQHVAAARDRQDVLEFLRCLGGYRAAEGCAPRGRPQAAERCEGDVVQRIVNALDEEDFLVFLCWLEDGKLTRAA